MAKNLFGSSSFNFGLPGYAPKKKRAKLTPAERMYVWEHPKIYGRKCNVCSQRIQTLSDLEMDHTVPVTAGGKKMALAHRSCNRMKHSKNLRYVQKKLGFKTATRKVRTHKTTRRKSSAGILSFNPEPIRLPKLKF
ncbi:HNH endonuclease [Candidatus Woesearchaeota archaeon]|nr:HNH endonuclease [Candidatus Woesearchaeota archaeon]